MNNSGKYDHLLQGALLICTFPEKLQDEAYFLQTAFQN